MWLRQGVGGGEEEEEDLVIQVPWMQKLSGKGGGNQEETCLTFKKERISKVRREAVRQRRYRESIAVSDSESVPEMDGQDDFFNPEEKELHPKTVLCKKAEFLKLL